MYGIYLLRHVTGREPEVVIGVEPDRTRLKAQRLPLGAH